MHGRSLVAIDPRIPTMSGQGGVFSKSNGVIVVSDVFSVPKPFSVIMILFIYLQRRALVVFAGSAWSRRRVLPLPKASAFR